MPTSSRRTFFKSATLGLTAGTLLATSKSRAAGADDRVRVAVIGCGNQGKGHIKSLAGIQNAEIAAVCDVDAARLAQGAEGASGAQPVGDFRRILDDKS